MGIYVRKNIYINIKVNMKVNSRRKTAVLNLAEML
jgi:hypothetical protein